MPDTPLSVQPTLSSRLAPMLTCTACDLYKVRRRICGGVGPTPCRLMFVGEAPGPTEDEQGAPFVGDAGDVLNNILRACEIERSEVVISNSVRCFPGRDVTGQINKLPKEALAACKVHTEREMTAVDPVVIVALGATAFKALTGKATAITKARGVPVEVVIGGKNRTVVPTFHPSYAMRSGGASSERANQIAADVRHALAILNPQPVEVDYRIVRTTADADEFFAAAVKWERFAFDIETRGLDLFDCQILGIGFSGGERTAWYVPVLWWNSRETNSDYQPELGMFVNWWPISEETERSRFSEGSQEDLLDRLKVLLENDARKVAHNGKFDVQRVQTMMGIRVNNWTFDTLLAAYALDENAKTLKLSDLLAQRYPDLIGYKTELKALMDADDDSFAKQPMEKIAMMCCSDCDGTYRLAGELSERLGNEGLTDYFQRFLLPTAKTLAQIEITGMAVDLDYAAVLALEIRGELERLLSGVRQRSGLPELNVNSNPQLAGLFFTARRYPVVKRTDKGGVSVDASVLEVLAVQHGDDVAADIIKIREMGKILSTYLDPLPSLVHHKTGRVHTEFRQHTTVSGRLSSSDPNLQNIPTRSELGHKVRGCFVASPGGSLICADYSQMELRILAHVSQDQRLIAACSANEDLHTAIARTLFNIPADQPVPKNKRSVAKNCQFAIAYGSGPDKIAQMSGISVGEADAIIRKWFALFKGASLWIQQVHKDIFDTGTAVHVFGGRRRAPDLRGKTKDQLDYRDQEMLRSIVNSMIQGPASHFCCHNMNLLADRLRDGQFKARVVLQVHDAVIVDCPDDERWAVEKLTMDTLLEPVPPINVLMAVELKVVKRWSDV